MSCATNDTTRPPHEEWSRVAPRLRPTHTGSPRASDALPLRTATDRAGPAAPFTWNELRHAERSRVAPRLRPPTDRAGPAAPATVRLLIVARPFVFHGGVERATAGLVTALAAHGYDVHVLSPPGQRPIAGVAQHVLPLPPLPSAVRVLALAALARVVVAGGGWDVVQSHERTLRQDIYRAGEGCHRAYLESIGAARGRRSLFHRVVLGLERRVFATTPHIVAISRRGAAEIAGLYGVAGERLSIVYNGVDLERFHPRNRHAERRAARAEIGVAADAWTLLFVGSGFERKGLATAVDALAVPSDRPSPLTVLRQGSIRSFRDRARRPRRGRPLHWPGPRPDIERWYAP